MMLLVVVLALGVGYLILKKERENAAAAPLAPAGAQTQQVVNNTQQGGGIASIESQLRSVGVAQNDIDAYIDWLISEPRSQSEIQRRVSDLVS